MYKSLSGISEAKLRLFYFPVNFLLFVDKCKPVELKRISSSLQRWAALPWDLLAPGGGVSCI